VQAGQQKKAEAGALDLQTAGDDAAASLQAKNPDRWTTLGGGPGERVGAGGGGRQVQVCGAARHSEPLRC